MTDRLVADGFVSFEQAELAGGTDGSQSPLRLTEALGYIGALAVFIATIALMFEVAVSEDFLFGGIDNIPGGLVTLVGAALLGWVGYRFTASSQGAVKRSGGLVLGSAFGLWVVTVTLLLQDLDVGDFTPLVVVLPIVVAAWLIWSRFQSVPTQLVSFVTVVQVVQALLVLVQIVEYSSPQTMIARTIISGSPPAPEWIATLIAVAVGVAWLWYTSEGVIRPRNTGFALGAIYAGFNGIILFGTADGWVVLFAAVTLAVLYGGLTWRSSVLLGAGAAGVLFLIVMVMSILVDSPTAVTFALWFGIPGLAALAYAIWSLEQTPKDQPTPASSD